ncbi:MAG TPA: hypothetical protein VLM90_12145 [Candidatus Deferrimicrobium sp.]|nr:hypothetical protein [Candidatus Deferrimicrobium sp.]
MPVFSSDPMRGRVKSLYQVFMSAGTYVGHARIGMAATFRGCLRRPDRQCG